ncbi:MAG: DUF1993 domain-containing protein [Pseudomonadota bacterium]
MAFTIRDASVPVYKRGLKNLDGILAKAEAHAAERGIDIGTLLDARLAPDMFDLKRQVQIACDHAKGGAGRLAGVELPKHEDNEKTVAELRARIQKTLEFINSIEAAKFDGAESRQITLKFPWATYDFTGEKFLTGWSLPNFYFHLTTAYDILRHNGVPLGKADFLGGN